MYYSRANHGYVPFLQNIDKLIIAKQFKFYSFDRASFSSFNSSDTIFPIQIQYNDN